MSSRMCNQCGCTDIDIDSTRGDAVCTGCGSVLEDQIIVSEVQFQESSGGGSSLIGQFVSSEGPGKSFSMGGSFPHGMQKESRTVTLQNGRRRIQQLASQMNLNQHCVDTAFNFFKMAVSKRMTRGRKTAHVIAACLYLVCRTERTPHMLLDFSDALQVNVYVLGRTYLQLSKELCINLPDIDPCLYISRFAHALQFEDKTHEVSMTAMRLVQRMKRDWMATGRRPSGLCGAALLVAARIHDFSRSVKEIIKVVKVCSSTLRKRLVEFEECPSSQLTIEEFQTIDLEEEQDPPCFTEGKRRARKAQLIQEQSKLPEYANEVSKLQEEIEETLRNQKPRGIWAAYAKASDDPCSVDSESSPLSVIQDGSVSNDGTKFTSPCIPQSDSCSNLSAASEGSTHNQKTSVNSQNSVLSMNEISQSNSIDRSGIKSTVDPNAIATELALGSEVNVLNGDTQTDQTTDGPFIPPVASLGFNEADSLGLGVKTMVHECMQEGSDNSRESLTMQQDGDDELDLTGIDDNEINKCLLSEKEVLVKTKIWMTENADYLEEQRLKEEKKAREAEEEAKKPPEKRKKPIKRKKREPMKEAATAQEAIQKIIQEKKISCKINYDVLNDLNVKSSTPKVEDSSKMPGSILRDSSEMKAPLSRILKPSVSFDLRQEGPVSKKKKVEPTLPMLPTGPVSTAQPEVVVESEPVQYEQKVDYEEEEEGYYDEDEGHLMSAAQLLGHTGNVEEDYDYDD